MSASIDITNDRYGRLLVIRETEPATYSKKKIKRWICRCDCGNTVVVRQSDLRSGKTVSCGCYNKDIINQPKTHGKSRTKLYMVYTSIKQRCLNPNNKNYDDYGGRGIKICNEWEKDYITFEKWAIDNGYKEGLTIDRINNDGNYEPSNCRWSDKKTQVNNQRIRKDNKTGIKGVFVSGNKFVVQLTIDGKRRYLGTVNTLEEARALTEEAQPKEQGLFGVE